MAEKQKPIIGVLALQGAVEPHRKHIEAAGGEFRAVKTPAQFEQVDAFIIPGGESTTMLKLIERFNLWDSLAENFAKKPVWGVCAGTILMAETVLVRPSSPRRADASLDGGDPEKNSSFAADPMDPVRASVSGEARQRDDSEGGTQKSFALIPMTVERNGYGRQLESHHSEVDGYPVSFIRAPVITQVNEQDPALTIRATDKAIDKTTDKTNAANNGTHPTWLHYVKSSERGGKDKGEKEGCDVTYMATTFHPELTQDFPSPMHRTFVDLVQETT